MDKSTKSDFKVSKPEVTLNANEKIYLSVIKKYDLRLYYVYMLVCRRDTMGTGYYAFAETDVATFKSSDDATVYADTVSQVAQYQKNAWPKLYDMFQKCNAEQIKNFRQNVQ